MKKLFYVKLLLLLISLFFIGSCSKQDVSSDYAKPNVVSEEFKLNNVKLENGILIFNSIKDIKPVTDAIQKDQKAVGKAIQTQFSGFVSQRKVFTGLTARDSSQILQSANIPSQFASYVRKERISGVDHIEPIFELADQALIVNKDGLLGFDGKIYQFTYNYAYEISQDEFNKNPMTDFSKYNSSLVKITPNVHSNHYYPKESGAATIRWNVDWFTELIYFGFNGSYKRFSGVISQTVWAGLWMSCSATTKWEFANGNSDQAARLIVSATLCTTAGPIQVYIDQNDVGNISGGGTKYIWETTDFLQLTGYSSSHSATDYNGNSWYGTLQRPGC